MDSRKFEKPPNLTDLLDHRELTQRFALTHAIAILAGGLVLVFEIEPKYIFRLLGHTHRLGVTDGILPR
jgi:hypothetical protein